MHARVISVNKSQSHSFSKYPAEEISLLEGLGVEGDAHMGKTVKHRSRVRKDPTQPNLRQVHLIHKELFDSLKSDGFLIEPGQIGENITTENIDLLNLPKGTQLHIGHATIEITGLRNPCVQLNTFQEGLMHKLVYKNKDGETIRKCGVMGIVLTSGKIKPGAEINIKYPVKPFEKLERV